MSEEQIPKKCRKREKQFYAWAGRGNDKRGRKADQKMKPFLTLVHFWRQSDENHVLSARDIDYFLAEFGIGAERRSIYRDINEINKIMLALEGECHYLDAEEFLKNDEHGDYKSIIYDPHRKGYYLQHRPFDFNDIQILTQCICLAKFVTEEQTNRLFKSICKFVSEPQEEELWEKTFHFEKGKTDKAGVFYNIPVIDDAMSTCLNGQVHIPEKIEFEYSEYVIDDVRRRPALKNTVRKTVSPYKFLVSDGNIFLLAYDEVLNQMQTYRIDYISNISRTGIPRTGREVYERINLHEYVRSNFLMQGNMQSHVSILFEKTHLDTVVQRFGVDDARYSSADSLHFTVDINVEINPALYNWLLSFGTGAKILKPDWAAEAFLKHIDKIKNTYNEKQ